MSTTTVERDYGLLGPEGLAARSAGLAGAKWYKPPIERARMKQLMKRRDGPAIRYTVLWLAVYIMK